MTKRSSLRLGAKLLATTCLVVGIAASASASGSPSANAGAAKAATKAGRPYCPPRTVCLYPHHNFQGKQRRYYCRGWAEGSHRSADLRRHFPWNRDGGVSSYQNSGVPVATLQTATPEGGYGQPPLPMNSSRNLGPSNDLATDLYVIC